MEPFYHEDAGKLPEQKYIIFLISLLNHLLILDILTIQSICEHDDAFLLILVLIYTKNNISFH